MGSVCAALPRQQTYPAHFRCGQFLVDTASPITLEPATDRSGPGQESGLVSVSGQPLRLYDQREVAVDILGQSFTAVVWAADVNTTVLGLDFFEGPGADLLLDVKNRAFVHRSALRPSPQASTSSHADLLQPTRVVSASVPDLPAPESPPAFPSSHPESPIRASVGPEPPLSGVPCYPPMSLAECARIAESKLQTYMSQLDCEHGTAPALIAPLHVDTGDSPPVFSPARPLFGEKEQFVRDVFRQWEQDGVVAPVDGEVEWASPVHVAKQPNGKLRVCGDFRRLNAVTQIDRYPLPTIRDFNAQLHGCCIFSKIDLKAAYHQVEVAPASQAKVVLHAPFGIYRCLRMPFGLKNAGQLFHRNLHLLLRDFPAAFVYMDDIIIASRHPQEHLQHLEELFRRLWQKRLRIQPSKCSLAQPAVTFLGHVVDSAGIRIPDDRVQAIASFPTPTDKKQLGRFLGMFAYVHRFIPQASGIVAPLHAIRNVTPTTAFVQAWREEHESAFVQAKAAIQNATLLVHPDPDARTEIWTDASDFAAGAVLVQLQRGDWHPVAYWSRSFNQAQRSYSAFDKEMLALSFALEHFRFYLEAQPIVVRTDHKPLVQALRKAADPVTPLQRRHLARISQLAQEVQYLRGDDNVLADALSRLPARPPLPEVDEVDVSLPLSAQVVAATPALPTGEALRREQEADQALMAWIERHRDAPSSRFQPRLLPVDESGDAWCDATPSTPRILVPSTLQRAAFDVFHQPAHPGWRASRSLILARYYWPKAAADIRRWARSCLACQRNKIGKHTKSPGRPMPVPSARFATLHIDLVGPLPANRGKAHLFTVIDSYTGWIEAFPLANAPSGTDAAACAGHLAAWISHYGAPKTIISDNGPQFVSRVWAETSRIMDFEHRLTSTYHPQANGRIERFHRKLKNALRARLDGQTNWMDHLPWVLFGLRTAPNTDTGFSPFELVFGERPRFPGESSRLLQAPPVTPFGRQLRQVMTEVRAQVPQWHQARDVSSHIPKELSDCAEVLVREDRTLPTLRPRYAGPYRVLCRHDKTFDLEMPQGTMPIAIDRLKPLLAILT